MSRKLPLVVAGIIFSLVAIIHLLRLVYRWEVTIGGAIIPMTFSCAGLAIAGLLAIWMFVAAWSKK